MWDNYNEFVSISSPGYTDLTYSTENDRWVSNEERLERNQQEDFQIFVR